MICITRKPGQSVTITPAPGMEPITVRVDRRCRLFLELGAKDARVVRTEKLDESGSAAGGFAANKPDGPLPL